MKYCPICGKVVPRGHGFKSDRRYCSYDCYRFKTLKMIETEKMFNKPLKEIILEYLNQNNNLTVTSRRMTLAKYRKSGCYIFQNKTHVKRGLKKKYKK